MKKLLFIPIFVSLTSSLFFVEGLDLDLHHLFGRCSGSNSYCSACSNCSSCKNCSVYGGSCAVCYTPKAVKPTRKRIRTTSQSVDGLRNSISVSSKKDYRAPQPDNVSRVPAISNAGVKNRASQHLPVTKQSDGVEVQEKSTSIAYDQFSGPKTKAGQKYSVEILDDAEIIMVIAIKANLRASATTRSAIVEEISYGSLLMKLGESDDWVKVQAIESGAVGYIFAELVQ